MLQKSTIYNSVSKCLATSPSVHEKYQEHRQERCHTKANRMAVAVFGECLRLCPSGKLPIAPSSFRTIRSTPCRQREWQLWHHQQADQSSLSAHTPSCLLQNSELCQGSRYNKLEKTMRSAKRKGDSPRESGYKGTEKSCREMKIDKVFSYG